MLHPRTVETTATEDDKIADVVRERRSSRYVARELGLLQPREVEVLSDDQYVPLHYSRCSNMFSCDCPPQVQFCECVPIQQDSVDR